MARAIGFLFFPLALLTGCTDQGAAQKWEVAELAIQVRTLSDRTVGMAAEIDRLTRLVEERTDSQTWVTFDPAADSGYEIANAGSTNVLVTFREVVPHADGSRVTLRVGNLTSADFAGGSMLVRYGKRAPTDATGEAYAEWFNALESRAIPFTTTLAAGSWTDVSLPMPGTKPDDLGYLALSVQLNRLLLNAPPAQM